MKKLLFILLCLPLLAHAQDKPAYQIYTSAGKATTYTKMIKALEGANVVFFGELHDDALCHWLELQVTKDLHAKQPQLALAMEMFEADDQLVLDEYLQGTIQEQHLTKEAKVWSNYATDYKPLVEYAKTHKLPVVASNIPRRYANLVFRRGLPALDSLSTEAKSYMAPLPMRMDMELPGYKSMIAQMGGMNHGRKNGSPEWIAQAQAAKDATMAHFTLKYLTPTNTVLHFNGAYHSQNREGIVWYLLQERPTLKITTLQVVSQEDISSLHKDNLNMADFIIAVPADMIKTYESRGFR